MTIWKIFAREASIGVAPEDFARECYSSGVIAVGWNYVKDLSCIASLDELKRKLVKKRPEKPKTIDQWAGSLWRFRNDVSRGDIVVCPDRDSGQCYIGFVLPRKVFYDRSSLGGHCPFAHRRKVKWARVLSPKEAAGLGRLGGIQTVSRIKRAEDIIKIKALLRRPSKSFVGRPRLPIRPDMEWGRAAEERAMAWLQKRGYKPQDVSRLNKGWDITCGDDRFEVKGRKSQAVAIRLTQNEWAKARHHKAKYTLLIFTAPTLEKLRRTVPLQIPNPTRTEVWSRRVTYEYILAQ